MMKLPGPQVRTGLLPLMLAEVLQLRAETKRLAKQSGSSLAKRLEHKQFALKYFANVSGPWFVDLGLLSILRFGQKSR